MLTLHKQKQTHTQSHTDTHAVLTAPIHAYTRPVQLQKHLHKISGVCK